MIERSTKKYITEKPTLKKKKVFPPLGEEAGGFATVDGREGTRDSPGTSARKSSTEKKFLWGEMNLLK